MTEPWTKALPPEPQLGDELPPPRLRQEVLHFLAERRSLTAAQMEGEPLEAGEVDALLRLAARVPDHRRVHPFRFIVFEGEARQSFGDVLAGAYRSAHGADEQAEALERGRLLRAGAVVCVVSSVNPEHKTPAWEQVLTAGAVSQNLLLAAAAAGYAGQWLTEWYSYDPNVMEALGLGPNERVVGFVYIGRPREASKERARMSASALTSRWSPQTPHRTP